MPSKRAIQAMKAHAAAGGPEGAIAQAKLALLPDDLDTLATKIREAWAAGVEKQLEVGRLLGEAYERLNRDKKKFGAWQTRQNFGFSTTTAYYLRIGAEREEEVRGVIANRLMNKASEYSVVTIVAKVLLPAPRNPEVVPTTDTTPVDPAYAAIRDAYNRVLLVVDGEPTGNAFQSMHVDDMAKAAGYLKALVEAYQEAKLERTAV